MIRSGDHRDRSRNKPSRQCLMCEAETTDVLCRACQREHDERWEAEIKKDFAATEDKT